MNTEAVPTCVWCNAPLPDVRSIPAEDPSSEEHRIARQIDLRSRRIRAQCFSAGVVFAVVVLVSAIVVGFVGVPSVLFLYALSGIVTTAGIYFQQLGQFSAGIAQGAMSTALMMFFGPLHPMLFFMLAAHIILAGFLWHWMTMIIDANR